MPESITTLGTNQSGMRAFNEKLVLTILRKEGAMPKAEIAKLTGLSAQTVSVIMRSLENEELLIKGSPQRGKVGQPSIPMSINPDGAYFFGLKIGRRSAELVLTDFMGKIIGHERLIYPYPIARNILDFAKSAHKKLTRNSPHIPSSKVAGLGVAIPFQLWNWAQMIGVAPHEMEHWRHIDIAQELSFYFDFPIYLQNDASSACGAELVFGEPQIRPANFLYIYIGYFVGGGMVLDNRLFTGPTGNSAALGPISIMDQNGAPATLLDTSSIAVFERMLNAHGLDSEFIWEAGSDWGKVEKYLQIWQASNAHGLAQAIHSALCVVDFEAIIIDGWLPQKHLQNLIKLTQQNFSILSTSGINIPTIIQGTIGKDARVLGAASLPLAENFMVDF